MFQITIDLLISNPDVRKISIQERILILYCLLYALTKYAINIDGKFTEQLQLYWNAWCENVAFMAKRNAQQCAFIELNG